MKSSHKVTAGGRIVMASLLFILVLSLSAPANAGVFFYNIPGPAGSMDFGESVSVLPNGNFVVTDHRFDTNKGAVFLYSPQGVLISRLTGTLPIDNVGSGGITVLANGNYVVSSPDWSNSYLEYSLGAVTWCSGVSGCSGTVSAANSLVGSTKSDRVGYDFFGAIIPLANGNYIIPSPSWDNGSVKNAGAVTWGNGMGGTVGAVSAVNSLVGSTEEDSVGSAFGGGITVLANDNYLVLSPSWDNGSAVDAGAVTWRSGAGGTVGAVSAANSLVGSRENDRVGGGSGGVIELTNSSYVVASLNWDLDGTLPDVGAVTWGSGTAGVKGAISPSNSLVGASSSAPVGDRYLENFGVTALTNGNYVVASPYWSLDGSGSHWGAATWGSGAAGVFGTISAANSLVGSRFGDYVGYEVIALTNGNYVVASPDVDLDASHINTGAITWGSGTSGVIGAVTADNSLVGGDLMLAGDGGVIALSNGNYVVSTPAWFDEAGGPINVGAVTWGNGASGITGPISIANSLVGGGTYDSVSDGGLVALSNGNYVVTSRSMGDGVGYVTWRDGSITSTGVVSTTNSLVGSTKDDHVGSGLWSSGVIPLENGNYVVSSPQWDNGGIVDAGAVTWGNGASGAVGVVSAGNSLVGGTANDQVGSVHWDGGVLALSNGNYVVSIPQWDHAGLEDVGAVTWGNGAGATTGAVSSANSLVGSSAGDAVGVGVFSMVAGVTELANGDYVVNSPVWSSASAEGAVTLGDGSTGIVGVLSEANSLVNTSAGDYSDASVITLLADGKAVIHFLDWNDGSSDGAVSLISRDPCITAVGPVSTANSVLGSTALGGNSMVSAYDPLNVQLIVGRPVDKTVTILRCFAGAVSQVYLPLVAR